MASGGDQRAQAKETLSAGIERGVTDGKLKLTGVKKITIQCGLKNYTTTLESSIWAKHAEKGGKCHIDKVLDVVFPDLAEYVAKNQKGKDKDAVLAEIINKLATNKPETKAAAVDKTTARLTDTSGYTGAHKERFDVSGKGKGLQGREDRSENTGYTGQYANAGTYDKAHK